MDRTATPNRRTAIVERGFERSRLSEEVLASAYERLLPVVRRPAGFPETERFRLRPVKNARESDAPLPAPLHVKAEGTGRPMGPEALRLVVYERGCGRITVVTRVPRFAR